MAVGSAAVLVRDISNDVRTKLFHADSFSVVFDDSGSFFGEATFAHHSFAAFDMQQMRIEDTVRGVQYTKEHAGASMSLLLATVALGGRKESRES